MSITVKVNRDDSGTPTNIEVASRGKKVFVVYDKNMMQIKGRTTEELRDIIKMFYPYADKPVLETLDHGELVSANATVVGAPTTTIAYTVPARKKLFILQGCLCSTVQVGVVAGTLVSDYMYIFEPPSGISHNLAIHYWRSATNDFALSQISVIEKAFVAGSSLRIYTAGSVISSYSMIGVLQDA